MLNETQVCQKNHNFKSSTLEECPAGTNVKKDSPRPFYTFRGLKFERILIFTLEPSNSPSTPCSRGLCSCIFLGFLPLSSYPSFFLRRHIFVVSLKLFASLFVSSQQRTYPYKKRRKILEFRNLTQPKKNIVSER